MGLSKTFKTNPEIERKGIVLEYGDVRIRAARAGGANKDFTKTLDRRTRPHRRAIANGSMDNDLSDEILMEVYAESVILDWQTKTGVDEEKNPIYEKGIDRADAGLDAENDGQGEPTSLLPVTPENMVKVFKNLPDFWTDLQQQLSASALFRAELDEQAAGN